MFRAVGGQVKRDYEFRVFEGGKYDEKGFLIKNFPLNAIVSITNGFNYVLFLFVLFSQPMVLHQRLVNWISSKKLLKNLNVSENLSCE